MKKISFLHTGDWQLGMTRHFFSEGVQERYSQARFDSIRRLGEIAIEQQCQFILVCGDAFESNQVDRKTVARTCEALKDVSVPVYILPGNHDPLNAASVYKSGTFANQCPSNVHVISDNDPLNVLDGVELVGAPWKSKKPVVNPLEELLGSLSPRTDGRRIVVGHGIVDIFTPDKDAPAILSLANLEKAVNDGVADYIALGDRHSVTKLGATERIWYSGTPESTDFPEDKSGYALLVELNGDDIKTEDIRVGKWSFLERKQVDLNNADDVSGLSRWLESLDNKERSVLRLRLRGGLTISLLAELQRVFDRSRDVFAGFDVRFDDLLTVPQDNDFENLQFSGFANSTVARLRERIEANGGSAVEARDALMLLFRLAEGVS